MNEQKGRFDGCTILQVREGTGIEFFVSLFTKG